MKGASRATFFVLALGAAMGPSVPQVAGALTAVPPVLGPGRVVSASAIGRLTAPADGRLRTLNFLATVTGVAWPTVAQADGHQITASPGHRLVVFSFSLSEPATELTPVTMDLPELALEVGKQSLTVPLAGIQGQMVGHLRTRLATGTATYAASVPDGVHRVLLAMTEGAFTQRFDLWTLRLLHPAPVVLYRAPTSTAVTASVEGTGSLTITDPASGFSAPLDLKFLGARLSEWAPHGAGSPAPTPTEAYLWVRILGTDAVEGTQVDHPHFAMHVLAGTRLVFTPKGGAPVAATSAAFTHGLTWPSTDDGLFDADYWFLVPATVTSGTLTVTAGPATGALCTWNLFGTCTPTATDTISAAHLELQFPDPEPDAPQLRPPWFGAPMPATGVGALGLAASSGHTAGGPPQGGGLPVWGALLIVSLGAGAVFAISRVRRWRRRSIVGDDGPVDGVDAHPEGGVRDAPADGTTHLPADPAAGTRTTVVEVPPLGGDGDLVVRVLGHLDIATCELPSDRRLLCEDLCAFLALHTERPKTTSELLDALWPLEGERGEATPKTAHNTVGRLRQAVGAEHLPDAASAGGYQLRGVVTDWDEIRRLLTAAAAASGKESRTLRKEALAHVRGAPFAGAHATQFQWAYASGLVSEMVRTIADCAHELSAELLAAGDPAGAQWAARQGLKAAVDDERLWLDAADAAARLGGGDLARVWRDAGAALGAPRVRELRRAAVS